MATMGRGAALASPTRSVRHRSRHRPSRHRRSGTVARGRLPATAMRVVRHRSRHLLRLVAATAARGLAVPAARSARRQSRPRAAARELVAAGRAERHIHSHPAARVEGEASSPHRVRARGGCCGVSNGRMCQSTTARIVWGTVSDGTACFGVRDAALVCVVRVGSGRRRLGLGPGLSWGLGPTGPQVRTSLTLAQAMGVGVIGLGSPGLPAAGHPHPPPPQFRPTPPPVPPPPSLVEWTARTQGPAPPFAPRS
jgi:hypothetical protein